MVIKNLTKLGRKMDEHNYNFNKEVIELKNITEPKNTLEGFNSKLDEAEERIRQLEEKAVELTQSENEKKSEDSLRDLWENIKQILISQDVQSGREKERYKNLI